MLRTRIRNVLLSQFVNSLYKHLSLNLIYIYAHFNLHLAENILSTTYCNIE